MLDNIEWFLVFICIDLFFLIICLNDIRLYNNGRNHYERIDRIARKLDVPVIYVDVERPKRGYYTAEFEILTKHAKETPENWITEQYARRMEKNILRAPEYWLWTHKRWKYTRADVPQTIEAKG